MTVASFIAAQRTEHRVPHAVSCRALEVTESRFYKWQDRPPTPRQAATGRARRRGAGVVRRFGGHPETYGSPRVCEDLVEAGWRVSVNTVAASMARQGLQGRAPKRKRRSLTRPDKAAAPIPDLVAGSSTLSTSTRSWCGDLTEIPTDEGKLYLATVLDLASRRLPGFAIGEHHDAAARRARCAWPPRRAAATWPASIFHTDKGSEYTGDMFAQACTALGVTQSMGRVGSAFDNAAAESLNSTLEYELLSRRHFATKDQARRDVARFIDRYNHRRRHSSCEMMPPVAFEQILADRTADQDQAA